MNKKIFRFKQFEIDHTNSAMKVGVDSVLLGAIIDFGEPNNLLDIGSGCGLLSIMAAQKTQNTKIIGIELELSAYKESVNNCIKSPWSNRLNMINEDINSFYPIEKFDFIISNPPYFQTESQSPSKKRNLARQSDTLSLEEFFINVFRLLSVRGKCSFIFPAELNNKILFLIEKYSFYLIKIINIYPKSDKGCNRHIYTISNLEQQGQFYKSKDITVRDKTNNYTKEYKLYTENFYL